MHSRIFEVVVLDGNKDFDFENYKSNSDFNEWSMINYYCDGGEFYDYVRDLDEEEIKGSIEWFNNCCPMFMQDGKYILDDENRKEFFSNKFEEFKKLSSEMTLDKFVAPSSYERCLIQYAMNDEFSFYMAVHNLDGTLECVYTLDEFVRYFNGEFVLVGALDYHF